MVLGKSVETVNNSFYVNLLHNVPFNTADDKCACIRNRGTRAPVPHAWRHCNDVSSTPDLWTTRINQKLWLNDHSWMIGCNKIFVPVCVYCSNAQN